MDIESPSNDGRFHARDCLLLPNLISLLRLPWVSRQQELALAVLLAAAATDVADGFFARRLGQATATGAVIDGILDKLFAGIIVGTLLWQQRVSLLEASLLATRELGELPLVLWWSLDRSQRRVRSEAPRANWLGKLATVIQFISVVAILRGSALQTTLIALTAAAGAAAAAVYWTRELRGARSARGPSRAH
jgi:phosphatidylglycerophosphate synthase